MIILSVIVLLLEFAYCTTGIAQSLGSVHVMHPMDASPQGEVLDYKAAGVRFVFDRSGNRIVMVSVFASEDRPRNKKGGRNGVPVVVPGESAYGILLGDSMDALASLRGVQSRKSYQKDGRSTVSLTFGDGSVLRILFEDEHVMRLLVSGQFQTPEGVCSKSTVADIERVYGIPYAKYNLAEVHGWQFRSSFTLLLAMICSGFLVGVIMRFEARCARQIAPMFRAVSGLAIGTTVSALAAGVAALLSLTPLATRELVVFHYVIPAAASGGIAAFLSEVLLAKCTSLRRCTIAALCVLAGNLLTALLAFRLWSGTPITNVYFLQTAFPLAAFVLGLLVSRWSGVLRGERNN